MQCFASLTEAQRANILNEFSEEDLYYLHHDWQLLARPAQRIPSGGWFTWLLRSGRGYGKTRTGSETVIQWATEGYSPIALVGQTKADVRDTMVEIGDSSIMRVAPPWFRPMYEPSKRRLTFPNGSICLIYSGDEPDQLRGPQHQKAWVDELAKFRYPVDTWDNLEMGLRKGDNPQIICTTTPRPIRIIKDLLADKRTIETRGNTLDNAVNLNPQFLDRMITKYQGTRLGRQELNGDILDDSPNALWKRADIDKHRVSVLPSSGLDLIYVGVDPSVSFTEDSDATGIIVAGIDKNSLDPVTQKKVPHFYVIGDYTISGTPNQWAIAVVAAFHKHHANKVIGEANNGGDLIEVNIRTVDADIPYKKTHASRGKQTRAEPVSSLYEQGKVHHLGYYPELEDEQCDWVPGEGESPDRIDALVWAITELMGGPQIAEGFSLSKIATMRSRF
jgi:phage terminase large subunit-like protein